MQLMNELLKYHLFLIFDGWFELRCGIFIGVASLISS